MTLKGRGRALWGSQVLMHPVRAAGFCFIAWVDRKAGPTSSYDGLLLVDGTARHLYATLFLDSAREALDLIREVDPRRHGMVMRHLRSISSQTLTGALGQYIPYTHACEVDIENLGLQWGGESHIWSVARLAATIVHEATHGRLNDAGFDYTTETRAMIERLCWSQGRAFAERLCRARPEFTHSVVPHFNVEAWSWTWHAPVWARIARSYRRYRLAERQ